jgi:hypothetical protein
MIKGIVFLCVFLMSYNLYAQNPSGMIVPSDSVMKYQDTSNQRDIIGVLSKATHIHIKAPRREYGKRVYYSLLPLGTSVPGGGTALITATTAGFYLGDRKTTNLSTITFSPSTNFQGQWNIPFHANIWNPNNTWNYSGDVRLTVYPQYTWGPGGFRPDSDRILIRYTFVRLYMNALKRIKPYLFAGFGYSLDYHINIRTDNDTVSLQKFAGYSYGTANHSNSFSSGLTFNILYDARNNPFNPLPGWYWNIVYRVNPRFLGSDDLWQSIYLDARKYIPFSRTKQNMLALWSFFWTSLGDKTPYLDLPAIGQDAYQRSGRGIYPSHYMGQTLYYLEAEYRRDITSDGLLGFVVFSNVNAVTEPHTDRFSYLHPAAGAGLRIKFNKHSGTNVTLDIATSKGRTAFYIGLGEVF